MMFRVSTRARAESTGSDGVRRSPGLSRGPRRKIVPIGGAKTRERVENVKDEEDEPLEYAEEFRADDAVDAVGRVSASVRTRNDITHVPFVAPRVMIGILSDLAERARRGPADGFADVAEFASKLGASEDALGDVVRRTESEIDRLEALGVRATAPVREIARGIVPEEVYEKYLAPAVAYAEGGEDGSGTTGGSTGAGEEFDDAAVNSAADAVAAAMAGLDLPDVDAGASAASSASSASERSTGAIEDDIEEMAANAIMSSSTVSASYVAPQTPYGAEAPAVRKNGDAGARKPPASAATSEPAPAAEPAATKKSTSTKAFDATVGYWRKINDQCPDEEPLMDIMDMNVVFRQAAGLLNYLRISRPTPTSWSVAANAGIIQIAEEYPTSGALATTPRRDLRSGDQTGAVSADDDAVVLRTSWRDDLAGSQTETFRLDDTGVLIRTVDITLESGDSWRGVYRYRRA